MQPLHSVSETTISPMKQAICVIGAAFFVLVLAGVSSGHAIAQNSARDTPRLTKPRVLTPPRPAPGLSPSPATPAIAVTWSCPLSPRAFKRRRRLLLAPRRFPQEFGFRRRHSAPARIHRPTAQHQRLPANRLGRFYPEPARLFGDAPRVSRHRQPRNRLAAHARDVLGPIRRLARYAGTAQTAPHRRRQRPQADDLLPLDSRWRRFHHARQRRQQRIRRAANGLVRKNIAA